MVLSQWQNLGSVSSLWPMASWLFNLRNKIFKDNWFFRNWRDSEKFRFQNRIFNLPRRSATETSREYFWSHWKRHFPQSKLLFSASEIWKSGTAMNPGQIFKNPEPGTSDVMQPSLRITQFSKLMCGCWFQNHFKWFWEVLKIYRDSLPIPFVGHFPQDDDSTSEARSQ